LLVLAAATLVALTALSCSPSSEPDDRAGAAPSSPAPVAPPRDFPSATTPAHPARPARNWLQAGCRLPLDYLRRIRRGYFQDRSPDVVMVPREPNFFGGFTSTTHSGPWPYVQEVPLVFYGPGVIEPVGEVHVDREATLVDLSPTLAKLLDQPWPGDRPGRALDGVDYVEGARPPKLILNLVWDGGGWNVLHQWPHAWPTLRRFMKKGASVQDVTVGTSPSVTPASHATMGTGTWPRVHGIIDIPQREGEQIVSSFPATSPRLLNVSTFADRYDLATDNEAKVGMIAYLYAHLGMMGHGAQWPGGDADVAVIADGGPGELITNDDYYYLPPYLQTVPGYDEDLDEVDRSDGRADEQWMGHDLSQLDIQRHSPVWELYQTRLLESLIEQEGYGDDRVTDLLFVNYKEIDDAGHNWNMLNPEMRSTLQYADRVLGRLEKFLDDTVGKGEWMLTMTADHGQAPDPRAVGAWPIRMQVLTKDLAEHFDAPEEDVILDERPVGIWMNRSGSVEHAVSEGDVANWLIDYRLEDNVPLTETLPAQYEERAREPVLAAAFPGRKMGRIWRCATERQS
jgi:hypothetical protein